MCILAPGQTFLFVTLIISYDRACRNMLGCLLLKSTAKLAGGNQRKRNLRRKNERRSSRKKNKKTKEKEKGRYFPLDLLLYLFME